MDQCSSLLKLPATFGLLTGLSSLYIDLAAEWQALGVGQLDVLKGLGVMQCTDEAITVLDSSGALKNLVQLSKFNLYKCTSMTKLPETTGLLTNLDVLTLWGCEKLQMLPNSIGKLKVLTTLSLTKCSSLQTLPDSLAALTSLQYLQILQCTSFSELPTSILSNLRKLKIEGSGELQSLPDSLRQLDLLEELTVMECGSLEGLGALRMLQGLRIWGCTSIAEIPGSCLRVLDSDFCDPALFFDLQAEECKQAGHRSLKNLRLVEANDTESGRLVLQRVHKSPCCRLTTV